MIHNPSDNFMEQQRMIDESLADPPKKPKKKICPHCKRNLTMKHFRERYRRYKQSIYLYRYYLCRVCEKIYRETHKK